MRIVSGRWRRRNLVAPVGTTTRPMPDRVREAVFETLGSRWGTLGKLPAVRVLDVFAGAGGVGLEALSRGAGWCGFVERDRRALKALRQNVHALLGDEADDLVQVLGADAFRDRAWQRSVRHAPVELVVIDPPYADSRDASAEGRVGRLLEALGDGPLLATEPVVVLRHEARVDYDQCEYGRLHATDARRYGDMTVTYLTNAAPA